LSDAWSRRRTIALGWILFAAVYVGFAFDGTLTFAWALMAGYGFHTGLIEPAERAYPALVASGEARATALGWYYFSYGMGLLPASLLFGLLWDHWGARPAFLFNAALTLAVTGLLFFLPSDRKARAV
jgi:MFS family permease